MDGNLLMAGIWFMAFVVWAGALICGAFRK